MCFSVVHSDRKATFFPQIVTQIHTGNNKSVTNLPSIYKALTGLCQDYQYKSQLAQSTYDFGSTLLYRKAG